MIPLFSFHKMIRLSATLQLLLKAISFFLGAHQAIQGQGPDWVLPSCFKINKRGGGLQQECHCIQSGCLRLYSTVTSFVKSTDDWYNGMDLGTLTGVVFIDLKKAFDTVDHDILCQKLEYYGIQSQNLAWFRSYLSNRKLHTRLMALTLQSRK